MVASCKLGRCRSKTFKNNLIKILQCKIKNMKKKNKEYRELVINCLMKAEGPLWVREIARRTNLNPQTVTNILDELALNGIIKDQDIARETKGKVKLRLVRINI